MQAEMTGVAVREHEALRLRFRSLYSSHAGAVLGFALRRVADPHDAADICAETFTVAWRRISEIPQDGELPWLYVTAGHVLNNQVRGRRRQQALSARLVSHLERLDPQVPTAPSDEVHDAWGQLPVPDQELLALSVWEDLTPTEIAGMLGVEPGVVRSRLYRARLRFRTALDSGAASDRTNSHRTGESS